MECASKLVNALNLCRCFISSEMFSDVN